MKDWEKKLRSWARERLVFLADRISPDDAEMTMNVHPSNGLSDEEVQRIVQDRVYWKLASQ